MSSSNLRLLTVACVTGLALSRGPILRAQEVTEPPPVISGRAAERAPAEEAKALDRWKAFREHLKSIGKESLIPEGKTDGPAPGADAIVGILYQYSPDLAAAQELLEKEPSDIAGARARLKKLEGTKDPYLTDSATLLTARCDLAEKKFKEAQKGFEAVLASSRNLATAAARRGLAESYRGQGETTFELLEIRFLLVGLAPDQASDRSWAEARLAEIRRDHPGPITESAKRMDELSTRLTSATSTGTATGDGQSLPGEQKKVEEILLKVAKLLEEEAKRCPLCSSTACKACKKCGACTATGMCPDGQHQAVVEGHAKGKGKGKGKGEKPGSDGDPNGTNPGGPAKDSKVAKGKPGDPNLQDKSKDSDRWGAVNEREVARSLQDLWGKIPPSYRLVVAQYFKDIAGIGPEGDAKK